jgi:ABC-2 type transport system ATP-binding protein
VTPALTVTGLSRRHGATLAVDGISFAVAGGEVFGLLGPNGAGKTTTIECLLGLVRPDAGSVQICGMDAQAQARAARAKTGAVLQATGLPDKITPREALQVFGAFYSHSLNTDALLGRFGLRQKQGAAYETLSGGQKQRLALALAFVGDPQLLVLDEPTAGLDVQMRRELHDHIREIKKAGRAVLLASHDMDEAQVLCDRIAVIAGGKIVATGTPADLIAGSSATLEEVILALTGGVR